MAVTATPIFIQTVGSGFAQIAPADTTTLKTLYTAGTNGSRLDNILVTSTDTATRDLQFVITISAVDYVLGTVTAPINTGFTASVPVLSVFRHANFNVALSQDVNGNYSLNLPIGAVLKVKTLTTVTTAKVISIICQGGDF